MPNNIIKRFAKKQDISISQMEKYWEKAKKIAKKKLNLTENDKNFYAVVIGILKNMIGLKEKQEDNFIDSWMINMFEAYPIKNRFRISYDELFLSEGRKSTGWEEKAYKGWQGEQLTAAEIARRGDVSKVAVTKFRKTRT